MGEWRFILTTLAGTELIEVWQARGRTIALPLNGLPTVSMSIDIANPAVDTILAATALERINLLLKAYRDGTLVFCGPLTSAEETAAGQEGTLAFGAAGPLWRLQYRMVGKSTAGYGDGTALAPKDLGTIAKNMIDVVNAEGDTGIRPGAIGASSNSYVGPWHFKKVAEAIAEIGPGALGGFDFDIAPSEPAADAGGVKIGTFNTYGSLGSSQPNAVFEYGTGRRNVESYRRPIDPTQQMNRGYALPPGFPDAIEAPNAIQTSSDAAAIAARGLFEDTVGNADIGPNDLRAKLAAEHVRIRKQPRETIFFTPVAGAQPAITPDLVGDTCEARAVRDGRVRFDAFFRIYGITYTLDDHGTETAELALINEG